MNETPNLEIECPHCAAENTFPLPVDITCKECGGVLTNSKYKQPLISAWLALFVGVGGTIGASQLMDVNRYPMKDEHTIIESCINESERPQIRLSAYVKRDVCACALAKTQEDIDADEYKDKGKTRDFFNTFEASANKCISEAGRD